MSNTVPDDPDQMAILYPGFKGVPEVEPFVSLHGRLSTRLADADVVIVIGFAFRDAYINSVFENTMRLKPSLRVLNSIPFHLKSIRPVRCLHDSVARTLRSPITRCRWCSGQNLWRVRRRSQHWQRRQLTGRCSRRAPLR